MSSVIKKAEAWLTKTRHMPHGKDVWESGVAAEVVTDLLAIVRKLPVTADGVVVVPGMNLYAANVDYDFGVLAVMDDPDNYEVKCRDTRGVEFSMSACDCYSTRAASEAAREASK